MKDFAIFSVITILIEAVLILITEFSKKKFPFKAMRTISRILLLLWIILSMSIVFLCGYISIDLLRSRNLIGGLKLIITTAICIIGIYVLFMRQRILKWKQNKEQKANN